MNKASDGWFKVRQTGAVHFFGGVHSLCGLRTKTEVYSKPIPDKTLSFNDICGGCKKRRLAQKERVAA